MYIGPREVKLLTDEIKGDELHIRQIIEKYNIGKRDYDTIIDKIEKIERATIKLVNTKKGYAIANVGDSVNISCPNSKTRRGRVGKGISQTLTISGDNMSVIEDNVRVRKLTPLECWRLMGFTDEEFSKAQLVCSDS